MVILTTLIKYLHKLIINLRFNLNVLSLRFNNNDMYSIFITE